MSDTELPRLRTHMCVYRSCSTTTPLHRCCYAKWANVYSELIWKYPKPSHEGRDDVKDVLPCSPSHFRLYGEACHSSLRCTTTFVIVFHCSLLLAFSPPFFLLCPSSVSLQTILPSQLCSSSGNLIASLSHTSAIISRISICPGHFTRPLNVLKSMQALVSLLVMSF